MGVLNIITKKEGLFTPVMIAEFLEVTKPMVANQISVLEEKLGLKEFEKLILTLEETRLYLEKLK